jgi:hypothetical protein
MNEVLDAIQAPFRAQDDASGEAATFVAATEGYSSSSSSSSLKWWPHLGLLFSDHSRVAALEGASHDVAAARTFIKTHGGFAPLVDFPGTGSPCKS